MQGLDIGSKLKYRGVTIGEVTRISFTYTKYQQDLPITQRERYVMVEAQLQPRLVGGRAAAGDMTNARERADGGRKGPAAAPRAAGHHRPQLSRDGLRRAAAAGAADQLDADERLHSERAVHGHRHRERGAGHPGALHKLDIEAIDRATSTSCWSRPTIASPPSTRRRWRSAPSARSPSSIRRSTRCRRRSSPTRRRRLLAELRTVERGAARRRSPIPHGRRFRTTPRPRWRASRNWCRIPSSRSTIANLERIMGRFDRIFGIDGHRPRDVDREPAPDHRQSPRSHRGDQTLSGQRDLRRAAGPAGAQIMSASRREWIRAALAAGAALGARGGLLRGRRRSRARSCSSPRSRRRAAKTQPGLAAHRHGDRRRAVSRPAVRVPRVGAQVRDGLLQRVPGRARRQHQRGDGARARRRQGVRHGGAVSVRSGSGLGARRLRRLALRRRAQHATSRSRCSTITYFLRRRAATRRADLVARPTSGACRSRPAARRRTSTALNTALGEILAELARDLSALNPAKPEPDRLIHVMSSSQKTRIG